MAILRSRVFLWGISIWILSLENGCESQNTASLLSSTNLRGALSVTEITPVATRSGGKVLVKGVGLDKASFLVGDVASKPLISTGEAIITVPPGNPGFVEITITAGSTSTTRLMYRLSGEDESPLYASEPSNTCAGIKYFDVNSSFLTGTKTCEDSSMSVKKCSGYDVPAWSSITESWICFSVGSLLAQPLSRDQFLELFKTKLEFTAATLAQKATTSCADMVNAGDLIFSVLDSGFYYCQDNAWKPISLSQTVIVSGETGAKGDKGDTGSAGADGATGAQGIQGATGAAGAFLVKNASNVTIGTLISFNDPIDASLFDSTLVYNSTYNVFLGIRSNGALASASSPAYELYQAANCPVGEIPAIAWGGPARVPNSSTPLSFAIGSTVYNYPLSTDTPTALARLSLRIDGGACINSPVRGSLGITAPSYLPYGSAYHSIAGDPSGRLYVAIGDGAYTSALTIATCLPTVSNPGCADPGSWTSGVTNAKSFVTPVIRAASDGRLYSSGFDHSQNAAGAYAMAFSTCLPAAGNSYCTASNAWTLVTNASLPGTLNIGAMTGAYDSTAKVSMEIDASGRIYLAYPAASGITVQTCLPSAGNAYCTDSYSTWSSGQIANLTSFESLMKIDSNGRLHMVYIERSPANITYATCLPSAGNSYCTASGWAFMPLGLGQWQMATSIDVSSTGKVMISYGDNSSGQIQFKHCQSTGASCATGANETAAGWSTSGSVNASVSWKSILAIDPFGTAILATNNGYAYCLASNNCAGGTSNWVLVSGVTSGNMGLTIVNGRIHIIHNSGNLTMTTIPNTDVRVLRPGWPAYGNKRNTNISPTYTVPLNFVAQ